MGWLVPCRDSLSGVLLGWRRVVGRSGWGGSLGGLLDRVLTHGVLRLPMSGLVRNGLWADMTGTGAGHRADIGAVFGSFSAEF